MVDAPPEPAWFYSSLAQSTATIVGFIGGFMFLRLQQVLATWRDIAVGLAARQMAWISARDNVRRREEQDMELPPELETELRRSWVELWMAMKQREMTRYPRNMLISALLLALLLVGGTAIPLLVLDAPTNTIKLVLLLPWLGLVVVLLATSFLLARKTLKALKAVKLIQAAEREFEKEEEKRGSTLGFNEVS